MEFLIVVVVRFRSIFSMYISKSLCTPIRDEISTVVGGFGANK